MAKANKVRGRDFMMFLQTESKGEVVALSTSCSLNVAATYSSTATKDDGVWDDKELDNITFSGSNEALMALDPNDDALVHSALFDALVSGKSVPVQFGVPANKAQGVNGVPEGGWTAPTSKYYKGNVKITGLDFSAPVSGAMTFTVSFEGAGALEYVEGAA